LIRIEVIVCYISVIFETHCKSLNSYSQLLDSRSNLPV